MSSEARSGGWRRLARGHRAVALLLLNTTIVLLAINVAAAVALAAFRRQLVPPPGPLRFGVEKLSPAYPGWSEAEIEALLSEVWSREYVYAPFVQHREGHRAGRFLNVDRHGFRHSLDQGPWPPDESALNIFVFGGSTSFGYGLPDVETIPSRLQAALSAHGCARPPKVYNFGRGNYYSEQERVLFELLLAQGRVPDLAVFIDGLNEWKEVPKFTRRLEVLMGESDRGLVLRALKTLPAVKLLKRLRGGGEAERPAPSAQLDETERRLARAVIDRWRRSRRMIEATAGGFGVRTVFVWQPVPVYLYELDSHPLAAERADLFDGFGGLRHGYELLAASRGVRGPGRDDNLLWLADIQRGRREALYVDAVHYTAAFSDEIARLIAAVVAAGPPCSEAGSP